LPASSDAGSISAPHRQHVTFRSDVSSIKAFLQFGQLEYIIPIILKYNICHKKSKYINFLLTNRNSAALAVMIALTAAPRRHDNRERDSDAYFDYSPPHACTSISTRSDNDL
jgi:hypothetical protein